MKVLDISTKSEKKRLWLLLQQEPHLSAQPPRDDSVGGRAGIVPQTNTIAVDFPGGTVRSYIDLLKELDPSLQIIVMEGVGRE